jgi:hypothetical protein
MRSIRSQTILLAVLLLAAVGAPGWAHGQGATITGRVMSDQGFPLQGANVYISELAISVGTNATGSYTITIPPARLRGQTLPLRARSVGFTPQIK